MGWKMKLKGNVISFCFWMKKYLTLKNGLAMWFLLPILKNLIFALMNRKERDEKLHTIFK